MTQEQVLYFAEKIGFKHTYCKAELKTLHTILLPDEKPIAMLEGQFKSVHDKNSAGYGLGLLTDIRFMFYRKSVIGTITREEFALKNIVSASYRKGLIFSSVHIYSAGVESIIDACLHSSAKTMVEELQKLLHAPILATAPAIFAADNTSELKKWHELKEQGIISNDEFEAKKKLLLNL